MAVSTILWLGAIFCIQCASTFVLNDKQSNLDYFIRTIGSVDPNVSSINYINGSVFGKQPGSDLEKLFYFEGYNINRKLPQPDGGYLSLSREFVVYRDPNTAVILQVWANPWTANANEIFFVANDPVNGLFHSEDSIPSMPIYGDRVVFNSDIVLEYPNELPPANYSKYSAGLVYDAVELFGFFANETLLATSQAKSVPMTGTWIRKSQYLPWMEMSTTPGGLYYTTMSWKCNEGLSCVADDIMDLIRKYYPKYQTAPTKEVDPNETSWSVFKKTIDQRRSAGLPDIIIPQVNATANVTTKVTAIDDRVLAILGVSQPIIVTFNASAWSEIIGKQPINLFDISGIVGLDFEPLPRGNGYRVQLDGYVAFLDPITQEALRNWTNPITGKTVVVKTIKIGVDLIFKKDFVYTMDIPTSEVVGLLAAQSTEGDVGERGWSVNFADLIFDYENLKKSPEEAMFYGTVGSFSNWFDWMDMADVPGNLVVKATVEKLPTMVGKIES